MQKVIELIQTHTYDFFIPLTALALLRLGLCLAQLKKTASIRKKKGVYHAVRGHYTEIGVWLGVLPACVLGLVLPKLWYAWLALGVVAAIVLGKAGQKKGTELDGIYREVAWELKHEAEAEAAREAAAHTLTPGAEELPETGEQNETTEDKGETENG